MILSKSQIDALLAQKSITEAWPWSTNDEQVIDKNIKDIVAEVRRKIRLLDKTAYGHYGSGYASFVDCWLYREAAEFKFDQGNCYWGLVVLFSRLSGYYVVGEGQKTWNSQTASSYLPAFPFVDKINQPAVKSIVDKVCQVLDSRGLERLSAQQLSDPLPREIRVPTVLSDPPGRHFDALFYWED